MASPVSYRLEGIIGVITVDSPPVNALSHAVREGVFDAISEAQGDSSEAIVISCDGRTFFAGADITEFDKPLKDPGLPDLVKAIEASSKPVVAAMHGTALGGGFEMALAAHYRCAMPFAKVGLPEVKLGLLPGAGGTQRTTRLAGVKASLDLITSGVPIVAAKAKSLGLIDKIIDGNLLSGAIAWAGQLVADQAPIRRSSEQAVPEYDAAIFEEYRTSLRRRARGQIASGRIVAAVEAAATMSFTDGLAIEKQAFLDCMASPESAGMRHIFFAEREAPKVDDLPRDIVQRPIETVGIIGGGTMGGGIAMSFANAGIQVTMIEISDEALVRGLSIIDRNYAGSVKRGKLSEKQVASYRALISGSTDYAALADVDMVVEAVFENPDLKKKVFKQLDDVCKPGAILATNTSYQDVDAIAAVTSRPKDVVGMHFFSPAHIMKLLEVVRGEKTADDVLVSVMALAKKIRKIAVVSGVCYGFIGNRMLQPYGKTSQMLLLEGATPQQIDSAMESWGMAMGPLRVFDLAGLDIDYTARQALTDEQKGDPMSYRVPDLLVEAGRMGQKSGAGFYTYDDNRKATSDPTVHEMIERAAAELGVERRDISDGEIVERLISSLVDEGRKILDEGIAQRSSDIDIVYIHGYGFPVARGGPMFYADSGSYRV
ncbi:MAG: 3-hydroxyacyl-CoA dehydrogenase [Gammaproteobacteria bacterium]|jgi:3-hydroxyacyl-CoA dehydrogenase|nr:3-hydroxyacyl-CoA dehydrogenase [Gammaproteobacteria bacterium]